MVKYVWSYIVIYCYMDAKILFLMLNKYDFLYLLDVMVIITAATVLSSQLS